MFDATCPNADAVASVHLQQSVLIRNVTRDVLSWQWRFRYPGPKASSGALEDVDEASKGSVAGSRASSPTRRSRRRSPRSRRSSGGSLASTSASPARKSGSSRGRGRDDDEGDDAADLGVLDVRSATEAAEGRPFFVTSAAGLVGPGASCVINVAAVPHAQGRVECHAAIQVYVNAAALDAWRCEAAYVAV